MTVRSGLDELDKELGTLAETLNQLESLLGSVMNSSEEVLVERPMDAEVGRATQAPVSEFGQRLEDSRRQVHNIWRRVSTIIAMLDV